MKRILLVIALLSLVASIPPAQAQDEAELPSDIQPVKIEIGKRVPIAIADILALKTYANDYHYYFAPHLEEGMRVLFSASYGIGGEAAQANGVVVLRDGKYWFKSRGNPSSNLLLAPGSPLNGEKDHSLWDLGAYMALINRVAFSDPNETSKTAFDVYEQRPEAALVDFKGGTAGQSVTYTDALEVVFKKRVATKSDSEVKIYYARNIGPVALEFRENLSPEGTFKFYLGK